jgi:tetratricopeptide (TPR) repeat protein
MQPGYAKIYSQALYLTRHMQAALEPAVVAYAVGTDQYTQDREAAFVVLQLITVLPPQVVRAQVPGFSDRLDKLIRNPAMHLGLGRLLQRSGFRDLATREYAKAVKLDPDNFEATVLLAYNLELYYQKYDEALIYLTRAHSLKPSDDQVSDRLIRLQNRLPARSGDLAWQIKDMLRKQPSPID